MYQEKFVCIKDYSLVHAKEVEWNENLRKVLGNVGYVCRISSLYIQFSIFICDKYLNIKLISIKMY